MAATPRITFGGYELDPATNELWKRGKQIKLPPQPARVLAMLASSPGELITRESFRTHLWDAGTFVDFEQGFNFCIRKIRLALKDDAKKPRFVETLPKRGYRFVGTTKAGTKAEPVTGEAGQILANEHYAKARAALGKQGKSSLDEAYEEFRKCLELKPDYAMAHSGMGATMALRMLNRRGHEELGVALNHLQRALALDGELSEPYPWLCFVHLRRGETAPALKAGHRGVELQPDLAQAHYFLGLAYLVTGEEGIEGYQSAVDHLGNAARVGPHWHATWFVLAYSAMLVGDYARAEEFSHRLLETYHRPGMPFIGGEIVLGSVRLRQGDGAGARQVIGEFLERMATSDHMYRDAMTAVAACVLGDVELREGRFEAALAAYRRAWQTSQEHTRLVAQLRISARAQAGLAAAYAALGQRDRAGVLLDKAVEMATEAIPISCASAGANLAELYLSLAAGFAVTDQAKSAVEMVGLAVKAGWRDGAWLERDPLFAPFRKEPGFRKWLAKSRSTAPIRWP